MQDPGGSVELEGTSVARVGVVVPAVLTLLLGVVPGPLFGILKSASVIRF
jgi:hypothetical protein